MFRKLMFASVAALGLAVPFVASSTAEASPLPVHHHGHCYRVFYRECCHEPWRCYGSYDCPRDAERSARRLRHRGFEAYVRS